MKKALRAEAEDYRRKLLDLRGQLQDEGKDAVDPGHSAGANDIKFNLACIEQLLASLPGPESVQRVVVCADPETGEKVAFAVVTSGRGGVTLATGEWKAETVSVEAPIYEELAQCSEGDETAAGRVVSVEE